MLVKKKNMFEIAVLFCIVAMSFVIQICSQKIEQVSYWRERLNDAQVILPENSCFHALLGLNYYKKKDYVKARVWLAKAAAQGEASAQYALGKMYANGDGGPQDLDQAQSWLQKACGQGEQRACTELYKH